MLRGTLFQMCLKRSCARCGIGRSECHAFLPSFGAIGTFVNNSVINFMHLYVSGYSG